MAVGATAISRYVTDQWSFYRFKEKFHLPSLSTTTGQAVLSWVDQDQQDRLRAYWMLDDYYRNSARNWLKDSMPEEERAARREYGEVFVLVEQFLASLIGENQNLWVQGATGEEDAAAAVLFQKLEDWMDKENFSLKMIECERSAVKLGDGVYTLGIDPKKKRPRLNVYDPDSYFPVIDDEQQGAEDFPRKVHIAYEYTSGPKNDIYVRRITWELLEVEEWTPKYAGAEPTTDRVWYTDYKWRKDQLKNTVEDFSLDTAIVLVEPMWMDIDFIPVVHVPNTVALNAHFGTAVPAAVMQIVDDLISMQTDLQAASATTGTPPLIVSGAKLQKDADGNVVMVRPGAVLEVGEGKGEMMDTSRSLDALLKGLDHLLERFSVNGRIPESLLGRVKPNEVPSGIALTLSFTPHASVIREMRKVRKNKYAILLRFASRMLSMLDPEITEIPKAELHFGSFLPADRQEAATLVTQLYIAKVISLETAISLLVEAGFTIDDAVLELERIIQRDYTSAQELLNITGDIALVYKTFNWGTPSEEAQTVNTPIDPTAPDPNADPTIGD